MCSRQRLASVSVGFLTFLFCVAISVTAQTPAKAPPRKLSGDDKNYYEALSSLTNAVISGKQPAPSDIHLDFHPFFVRSAMGVYIPYGLDVEAGKITVLPAALYVRAVPSGSVTGKPEDGVFDDFSVMQEVKDNSVRRALQLNPGNYDVYFALREKPNKDKKAPPPHTVVLKQQLQVPDLTTGLALSSVILATNIEPAAGQLTPEQLMQQPFVIGGINITPSVNATFKQSGNFEFVFFVYNGTAAGGGDKPNIQIEMSFFAEGTTTPKAELKPQVFNAETLPPEFSLAAGHVVSMATGVPLASFTPGKYRFDIKVTDKANKDASVTRSETFTVTAP